MGPIAMAALMTLVVCGCCIACASTDHTQTRRRLGRQARTPLANALSPFLRHLLKREALQAVFGRSRLAAPAHRVVCGVVAQKARNMSLPTYPTGGLSAVFGCCGAGRWDWRRGHPAGAGRVARSFPSGKQDVCTRIEAQRRRALKRRRNALYVMVAFS